MLQITEITRHCKMFVSAQICTYKTCADPESIVRGGPTLTTFLVDEGREDPNATTSGPSSARHRNTIKMAFRWRAFDGSTLNTGLGAL